MRWIRIFDTTLRDGEQTPGVNLSGEEKLRIAKQLSKLGVDVIEAGFPATSKGELNAVKKIAENVHGPVIAALARAVKRDIDAACEALEPAERKRIHTFIATSPVHMKHKLRKSPQEVKRAAVDAVEYAKKFVDEVEFSFEDATRSDRDFLVEVGEAVIEAGATVLNVPDTVGYATPEEFADLIRYLRENLRMKHVELSVHCHDDLGLAVANSLAAAMAGADQIEVTVNGIGERAGNAALEEVVMAIDTRRDFYKMKTGINLREIARTSWLVSIYTGIEVPPNKAVVGANAFTHESGIHQDGVLKERSTYEIMNPEKIGFQTKIVLGKHSGRHALRERLRELGYEMDEERLNRIFEAFKELTEKKKVVTDLDLLALMEGGLRKDDKTGIEMVQISHGLAVVSVRYRNRSITIHSFNGPVDAIYQGINSLMGVNAKLVDYRLYGVTEGRDALGEAIVRIRMGDGIHTGRGISTDVLEASLLAYVNAINKARRNGNGFDSSGEDYS